MIVDAIIALVSAILSPIFAVLPGFDFSGYFADHVVPFVGGPLLAADSFLPVHEMLGTLAVLAGLILPGVIVYRLANWAYRHIPQLGGFGPGSG